MAKLADLMPELKIEDTFSVVKKQKTIEQSVTGKKRRAWINEDSSSFEKGSIDGVYGTSIAVSKKIESSNGDVDNKNRPMNTIYRPLSIGFNDLRSNPLQLIKFFFALTELNNSDYETRRVRLKEVTQQLNISKDSARTALRFLLKNKLIMRIEYQVGVYGWSRYQIKKELANQMLDSYKKGSVAPFKVTDFTDNDHRKDIMNPKLNEMDFDSNWNDVDISHLEKVGFKKQHLSQLKSKITSEVLQESINHFSFALENNEKVRAYPNPIATFMAVMKRGEAWIEPNYRSPLEIAQQQFLESKKSEIERLKKLEKETYELAFSEWKDSLDENEIKKIAPDLRGKGDPTPPQAKLGIYFAETIWPDLKKEYLVDEFQKQTP